MYLMCIGKNQIQATCLQCIVEHLWCLTASQGSKHTKHTWLSASHCLSCFINTQLNKTNKCNSARLSWKSEIAEVGVCCHFVAICFELRTRRNFWREEKYREMRRKRRTRRIDDMSNFILLNRSNATPSFGKPNPKCWSSLAHGAAKGEAPVWT